MNCEEAREVIAALVDGEISDLERLWVQDHLENCPECRHEWEQERSLKEQIHRLGRGITAPTVLRNKILQDYGIPPGIRESHAAWKQILSLRTYRQPVLAFAMLALVLFPVIYLVTQPNTEPASVTALQAHSKIARGELSLRTTGSQQELRAWQISAVNGEFEPVEFDLHALGLEPVGGLVHDIDGRKVLVTVYRGSGRSITCFTFLGTGKDAPRDAESFFDQSKNVNFYIFSRAGYNAVLHREGDVICLLVSAIPAPDLLAIAQGQTHS